MENVISALGGPGGYLVGRFLFIFFAGLVLTPIVSWLVLRRYRAATRKLMRRRADPDQKRVRAVAKATNPQRPSLRIELIEGDEVAKSAARQPSQAGKTAVRGLRSTAFVYIIETLLNTVDLRQIIFLTDDSADKKYLQQIINELWQTVSPSSPNAQMTDPTVRLFDLSGKDARNAAPWLLDLLTGE